MSVVLVTDTERADLIKSVPADLFAAYRDAWDRYQDLCVRRRPENECRDAYRKARVLQERLDHAVKQAKARRQQRAQHA